MTVSSGFFNSVNHDRLYDAEQLSSIFDGIIIDGVYENYGEAFLVQAYPDSNSTVIIGTGRAWFDHTWTLNDSQFSMTLDPPNEMLGRTDAIVIDVNNERNVRKNNVLYIKGSESEPDNPPDLINTELHKQYPICWIKRTAGSDAPIKQSEITYLVGTSSCPMVTGILEAQNLENLMAQLSDEFNTWWNGIKDVLDENTATSLQNQINEINKRLNSETATNGLLEKGIISSYSSGTYNLKVTKFNFTAKGSSDFSSSHQRSSGDGCSTILPDGKIVCWYNALKNNSGSTYKQRYILVDLYTKEGVKTSKSAEIPTTFYSAGRINNIFCQIDSYPVKIMFAITTMNSNSSGKDVSLICTLQVTSTEEIYIEFGTEQTVEYDEFYAATQDDVYANACRLSDGSYIFGGKCDTTQSSSVPLKGHITMFKVTSDGTFSGSHATDVGHGTEYGAASTYIHNIDEVPTLWDKTHNKFTIDTSTLIVTKHEDPDTEPNIKEKGQLTNYSAEMYTVSESGGCSKISASKGQSYNGVTSRVSNYFLGATNLCEIL